MTNARDIVDALLEWDVDASPVAVAPRRQPVYEARTPDIKTLKDNRTELDDSERRKVMSAGAVWHMGNKSKPTPAVWKSKVRGQTWFVCNTHRCYRARKSLGAAIRDFKFIETTG
jgi:hypothetical protein